MAGYFGLPQATLDYLASRYYDGAVKAVQTEIRIFVAENLAIGIKGSGKTKLIADAMKEVSFYASTGSLYEVYDALEKVVITTEMAPFLTEGRKQYLKNRIISILNSL